MPELVIAATGQAFQQVRSGFLELRSGQPNVQQKTLHCGFAADLVAGTPSFRFCGGHVPGSGGDCEAELNVRLDLAGICRFREKVELNRLVAPNIVDADVVVSNFIAINGVWIRLGFTEPGDVQRIKIKRL